MDSPSVTAMSLALAVSGFRVARFEFDYMAGRRIGEGRKAPPRAEKLIPEYLAAVDALAANGRLIIGGKSMGARVASMIADELYASGRITGLLCLGYPFHPPGKPDQLRTRHLGDLKTPTLIVQGTRDVFGARRKCRLTGFRRQSRFSGSRTATTISSRARTSPGFRRPTISRPWPRRSPRGLSGSPTDA
jgi:uncharacterized protein